MTPRYRTGSKNRRVIYYQPGDQPEKTDPMVGTMDTPELGTLVADLLTERLHSMSEPGEEG